MCGRFTNLEFTIRSTIKIHANLNMNYLYENLIIDYINLQRRPVYVHFVMHTFIMVKLGGKQKRHKVCKKARTFYEIRGEFAKVAGK